MSDTKYPPRGALFRNKNKTSDKHPDLRGDLEISREVLQELVNRSKEGKELKMEVSAWKKHSDKAGPWLSLAASKPYEKTGNFSASPRRSSSSMDDDAPF